MLKSGIWADEIFIRGTAFFLNMDIEIHQNKHPRIERISGNMDDLNIPCNNPVLHVGYLSNLHYQSIIPRRQIKSKPLDVKEEVVAQENNDEKGERGNSDQEDLQRDADKAGKNGEVTDGKKEVEDKSFEGMYL